MDEAPDVPMSAAGGPGARTRDPAGGDAGYCQIGIPGRPFAEPGSVAMGINNSIPVAGDSSGIVGWHDIDIVVHGSRATAPPRTTAG